MEEVDLLSLQPVIFEALLIFGLGMGPPRVHLCCDPEENGGKGEIMIHAHGPSRICVYRVRDDCIISWKAKVVQRYFKLLLSCLN